jgi:O-antigen/teichoic acid export membrane protein
MTSTDRFVINAYFSPKEVGIYALAFLLGSVVNIVFIMPFSQIWSPMRMQYRNDANAQEFYAKVLVYYFLIGFMITVFISSFAKEFLVIFSGKSEYGEGWYAVPMIMLAFLLIGCMKIIDNGIHFSRKVQYHAYVYVPCAILNSLANITFIPIYGYGFGAVNLLITFVIALMMVGFISNKIEKVQIDKGRLAKIFVIFLPSILSIYLVGYSSLTYFGAIFVKVAIIVIFCVALLHFALTFEEKRRLKLLLSEKFMKSAP